MYREVLIPVDNSQHSDWAVDRALELCVRSGGRITGNHVYAARLHDVRFRQLETGLPAQFQTPKEIKRQRKVHDKLIEKGLQLISDSFLDQLEKRCAAAAVTLRRQLLEGINFEEIVNEVNRGEGQLPSLIGFDPNIAANYDGGERVRSDVPLGEDGRIVGEDEELADKLAGASGREYDLVVMGAHGIGQQSYSQLGSVVSRAAKGWSGGRTHTALTPHSGSTSIDSCSMGNVARPKSYCAAAIPRSSSGRVPMSTDILTRP